MEPTNPTPIVDPLRGLLRSRKFLLLLLNTVASLTVYLVGLIYGDAGVDVATKLIAILQPVVVALILAIALEDAAEKRSQGLPPGGRLEVVGDWGELSEDGAWIAKQLAASDLAIERLDAAEWDVVLEEALMLRLAGASE